MFWSLFSKFLSLLVEINSFFAVFIVTLYHGDLIFLLFEMLNNLGFLNFGLQLFNYNYDIWNMFPKNVFKVK